MNNAPCKNCPERHIKCHSECEKYIEFRKERDAVNLMRFEQQKKRYDGIAESMERMKNRPNKRFRRGKK